MHKSRLAGIVVDCDGDLDAAANFWGRALGHDSMLPEDLDDGKYRELDTGSNGNYILIQSVDHASRVHLDIETDDIEAEVRRLEALGAKKIEQVKYWWVMEAPTGHRFCVIPAERKDAERKDFAEMANEWS